VGQISVAFPDDIKLLLMDGEITDIVS